MKRSTLAKFAFVLFLPLSIAACSSLLKSSFASDQIGLITYRFVDSSVSPEYHRSYSIEVSKEQIRLVVDSYGTILLDESFESNPANFERVLNSFRKSKIKIGPENKNYGCAGGNSEKVLLSSGNDTLFSGYTYHCMGSWGTLRGNVVQFATEMKGLIPDLNELVASQILK